MHLTRTRFFGFSGECNSYWKVRTSALTPYLYRPTSASGLGPLWRFSVRWRPYRRSFSFRCFLSLPVRSDCTCSPHANLADVRFMGHVLRNASRRTNLAYARKRSNAGSTRSSILAIGLFFVPLFFDGRVGFLLMHRIPISGHCYGDSWRAATRRFSSRSARLLAARMERHWMLAIVGLASFLAPFAFDNFLQRHYQTYNNAVVGFFCVVHDATRFWTSGLRGKVLPGGCGNTRSHCEIIWVLRSHLPGCSSFFPASRGMRHDLASLSHPAFGVVLMLTALVGTQYFRRRIAAGSIRSSRVLT